MSALGLDDEFWPDDRPEPRRPAAVFLSQLTKRVAQLGNDTKEVGRRIQGDIALAREQFGEMPFITWR